MLARTDRAGTRPARHGHRTGIPGITLRVPILHWRAPRADPALATLREPIGF